MRPLPLQMLRHSATLTVPDSVTGWHAPDGSHTAALSRIHVQLTRAMDTTGGYQADMDVKPRAELWYDCHLSTPRGIDFIGLQRDAEAVGGHLRVTAGGVDYRVSLVDLLPDDRGNPHHYRLELI